GLLEHACARGDVPVYFDRGTSRPDPAGRAFVALLSCAVEGLSAKRFDEYLSLGQVPRVGETAVERVAAPSAEVFHVEAPLEDDDADVPAVDSDDEAIVEGMLRSTWQGAELLVGCQVFG